MLYVVELALADPAREVEWAAWYSRHLDILLSVPGFNTAQRFRCLTPWTAPYMAVYSIASSGVMESEAYRNRGGRESPGEWKALMINWDRNLFEGIDGAPGVREGEVLAVTEAAPSEVAGCGIEFIRLENTGLDRTVGSRGIAVVSEALGRAAHAATGGRVRPYAPLGAQRTAGA